MSGSDKPRRWLFESPPPELPKDIRPTPGAFGHAMAHVDVHLAELERERLKIPRRERRRLEREQLRAQRRGHRRGRA